MDNFNLMPQPAQPVNRTTTGLLPDVLAELSEEALSLCGYSASVLPSFVLGFWLCSYDGDDAE